MRISKSSDKQLISIYPLLSKDEGTTTLAGLLTTPGYSNDITKSPTSGDGKASSRESRGETAGARDSELFINLHLLSRSERGWWPDAITEQEH